MSVKKDQANLAKVKTALADKYENLANVTSSKPRRARWLRLVGRFRRQAEQATQKSK